jgi:hypothetical protein
MGEKNLIFFRGGIGKQQKNKISNSKNQTNSSQKVPGRIGVQQSLSGGILVIVGIRTPLVPSGGASALMGAAHLDRGRGPAIGIGLVVGTSRTRSGRGTVMARGDDDGGANSRASHGRRGLQGGRLAGRPSASRGRLGAARVHRRPVAATAAATAAPGAAGRGRLTSSSASRWPTRIIGRAGPQRQVGAGAVPTGATGAAAAPWSARGGRRPSRAAAPTAVMNGGPGASLRVQAARAVPLQEKKAEKEWMSN